MQKRRRRQRPGRLAATHLQQHRRWHRHQHRRRQRPGRVPRSIRSSIGVGNDMGALTHSIRRSISVGSDEGAQRHPATKALSGNGMGTLTRSIRRSIGVGHALGASTPSVRRSIIFSLFCTHHQRRAHISGLISGEMGRASQLVIQLAALSAYELIPVRRGASQTRSRSSRDRRSRSSSCILLPPAGCVNAPIPMNWLSQEHIAAEKWAPCGERTGTYETAYYLKRGGTLSPINPRPLGLEGENVPIV